MECSSCNHQNPSGQKFCGQCGAQLASLHPFYRGSPVRATLQASVFTFHCLHVVDGNGISNVMLLDTGAGVVTETHAQPNTLQPAMGSAHSVLSEDFAQSDAEWERGGLSFRPRRPAFEI